MKKLFLQLSVAWFLVAGFFPAPAFDQGAGVSSIEAVSKALKAISAVKEAEAATVNVPIAIIGGGSSDITTGINATRISGVAPLSVIFEATGTTATSATYPFHELRHRWDYGDPKGEWWAYGSNAGANDKNLGEGPIGAHIFETAGVYTVTYTASNATGSKQATLTITVSDPDSVYSTTNTICISAAGGAPNFSGDGCPTGASTVTTSTCSTAFSNLNTGKRLLFHRGESWNCAAVMSIGGITGWTIGAYGTGARPSLTLSGTPHIFQITSSSASDGRIMDLALDGGGSTTGSKACVQAASVNPSKITILRVDCQHIERGIAYDGTEFVVAEFTCSNISTSTGVCIFINQNGSARDYYALLGSSMTLETTAGYETIRVGYGKYGLISNSYFGGPNNGTYAPFKFHSPSLVNPSEWNVISDNWIKSIASAQAVELSPQDNTHSQLIRNLIYERNLITETSFTYAQHYIQGKYYSIRNNISTTLNGEVGVYYLLTRDTGTPPPDNVWIYDNTAYRTTGTSNFLLANITSGTTNTFAKNNLAYRSGSATCLVINNNGTGTTASNNSSNALCQSTRPWSATSPVNPIDFKPTSGTHGVGGGTATPLGGTSPDFFRVTRPSPDDLGAIVH